MGGRMSSILELPLDVGLGSGLGRSIDPTGLTSFGSGISISGNMTSPPKLGKTNALAVDSCTIAGGEEPGIGGGIDKSSLMEGGTKGGRSLGATPLSDVPSTPSTKNASGGSRSMNDTRLS